MLHSIPAAFHLHADVQRAEKQGHEQEVTDQKSVSACMYVHACVRLLNNYTGEIHLLGNRLQQVHHTMQPSWFRYRIL